MAAATLENWFHLRDLAKVRGEWNFVCLTHNLLKILRHQCALT